MPMTTSMNDHRSNRRLALWVTPVACVGLGIAMGAAAWAGGDHGYAAFALGLMLTLAAATLIAARASETVRGILDRRDERIAALDRDATLVAGLALIVAVFAGFLWKLAIAEDAQP